MPPPRPASNSSSHFSERCANSSRRRFLTFDVIVVGAGPAGATAAKLLGEAGVSTLLLDKSAFPRDKPCGGGISARVTHRFPYLESALATIPVNWVNKVYLESPAGFTVDYQSEHSSLSHDPAL